MSKDLDDEVGVPFWASSVKDLGEPATAEGNVDIEEKTEHTPAIKVSEEPAEKTITEPTKVEHVEKQEASADYVVSFLDEVDSLLEEEGLLVDTGKSYSPDAKGVSEMLKDTIAARDAVWETKLAQAIEFERDSISRGDVLKAEDMDVYDEDHAKYLLTQYYLRTDWEQDEIDEKLQTLGELGELSKEANVAKRYMVKVEKAEEQERIAARQRAEQEEQKYIDDYVSGIKSDIDKTEEIVGFKLDKKTRDSFKSYLFDVEKDGKTKAQKAGENQDHRLTVAFMDFMNYSKKDLELKVRTELAIAQDKKNSRYSTVGQEARMVNRREREDVGIGSVLNSIGMFNGSPDQSE